MSDSILVNGGATLSKRASAYVGGVYCNRVSHGLGNNLILSDGSVKFDTVSGLGSCLWSCTNNYGLECAELDEAAELFLEKIGYHSAVKFTKNGSDACSAAVRYMRAYTGRERIRFTGYHGCDQGFVACTPPAVGCIDEKFYRYDSLEALCDAIEPDDAGVIIEPLELELAGLSERLQPIRDRCTVLGVPLCFDEIITGWRTKNFSVGNMLQIYPDLSCFGKALANGHPIGICAVTDTIHEKIHETFISTTFGGEQQSLQQMIHTLKCTLESDIEKMWDLSSKMQDRINNYQPDIVKLVGYPARYVWECPNNETKAKTWQELYDRGVFVGAAFFPKLSWREAEYNILTQAIIETIDKIDEIKLRGSPPRPAFKRV